jgi:hypothetical protein
MGTGTLLGGGGGKVAGHGVNHLLPSGAEVKNEWRHACTPSVCLCGFLKYFQTAVILISVVFYKDFTTVTVVALKKKKTKATN